MFFFNSLACFSGVVLSRFVRQIWTIPPTSSSIAVSVWCYYDGGVVGAGVARCTGFRTFLGEKVDLGL